MTAKEVEFVDSGEALASQSCTTSLLSRMAYGYVLPAQALDCQFVAIPNLLNVPILSSPHRLSRADWSTVKSDLHLKQGK